MGEPWPQIIKLVATAVGIAAGYLFGGWDVLINLLLLLVVVDWLSGWAAAWMRGELKSRIGFKGIIRKVTIFVIVAIAHFIDQALGSLRYFQDAVIFFYLANELLSVIENMGKMGLPMPDVLRNAVRIFESKKAPSENPNLIEAAQPDAVKAKGDDAAAQTEPPALEEQSPDDKPDIVLVPSADEPPQPRTRDR
ncbi:phage holin family protein [Paenibacillus campi]|uniref:phage holin family protein n=1 Tax=Paenibacillus campi TaxID=3106031 RepID=UPI002AFDCA1C|nr:phage holin family protein [Paenibacillus sp. SGZ-1014]